MIKNLKIGEVYVRLQFKKDKKIIDIIKREEEKYINLHKEEPIEGEEWKMSLEEKIAIIISIISIILGIITAYENHKFIKDRKYAFKEDYKDSIFSKIKKIFKK